MADDLIKLYNTLVLVETKGESTKTMASCLRFLEQMMVDTANRQNAEKAGDEHVL